MISVLLDKLLARRNRQRLLRVAETLEDFSIKDKALFRGQIVAAGDGKVNLGTCSIIVGDGSLVLGTVHFERDGAFLRVGRNSFVGMSDLIISTGVTVGDDVLIAYGCMLQDHDAHSRDVSLRRGDLADVIGGRPKDWSTVECHEIVIEDGAWIGARAIILKGVTVGKSAIVGAGSVVARDVRPSSTVVGNPAREARKGSEP